MANTTTSFTVEPTRIVETDSSGKLLRVEEILVAHRMVEQYLGTPKPLSFIVATYSNVNPLQPLAAVEDYPINQVNDATDANGASLVTTNDDRYVWVAGRWSTSTITLQYLGGIEQPIYDAIIRQSKVLEDRDNRAPEIDKLNLGRGAIDESYNTQYRTSLSSDVRGMLFPFKLHGF